MWLPVRAAGLLLRGSGYDAAETGVQSYRRFARHLGKNRKEIQMIILGLGGILSDPACAGLDDGQLGSVLGEEEVAPRPPSSGVARETNANPRPTRKGN